MGKGDGTRVILFAAPGAPANDRDGAEAMRAEFVARWEKHSQDCRASLTPERKARASALSRAAWARRKAALALAAALIAGPARSQGKDDADRDWPTRGVAAVSTVYEYCQYLDKFIPLAFRNNRHFLAKTEGTAGAKNQELARLSVSWAGMTREAAQIWGSLGCAQIIYR